MSILEIRDISKSFNGVRALRNVSFEVAEGEIVGLLGPSGCGKTTLLRIIAGLEKPDEGRLFFAGRDLGEIPVHRRGFGLMFQDYALFPHKNLFDNVAFGLRMQGEDEGEIRARVGEILGLVGLGGLEGRAVQELSGGEQQRVALARSLAPRPRLLMLDEPLGSLDRALRERLMNELRSILKGVGVTALYVTHDQEEAFAIADRLVLMNEGRVVQEGTPQAVYCRPANLFVARFLGLTNLLAGRVLEDSPDLLVQTAIGPLHLAADGHAEVQKGQELTVLVRPEAAALLPPGKTPAANVFNGVLRERSFRGGRYRLLVRDPEGVELTFELEATTPALPGPGEQVRLALRREALTWVSEDHQRPGI
jgi:ABC-type Fe3+/spermidine/putrescine transport system ATPase subunit